MSLAQKKLQTRTSVLIIGGLLLVIAAVYAFTWYRIQQTETPLITVTTPGKPVVDRAERRQSFFETVGALRQYGTWPILDVRLSPDRGNPFIKKPSS
ncbi:MAG: hypothetical protein KBB55_04150 [Candidatus Buchananbacteria bacterium]|nr:hypothetical protein [Candidatus Buchananbacteria bacterium]